MQPTAQTHTLVHHIVVHNTVVHSKTLLKAMDLRDIHIGLQPKFAA